MKKVQVIKDRAIQEMNLTKTAISLTGGQVSSDDRVVFQDDAGKLWRIKKGGGPGHTLREYLGFTAYRALGIRMPNFHLAKDDDIFVLLQEYIPDENETHTVKTCGTHILQDDILNESLPIIIASVLLGDTDVIGKFGDNILFERDKNTGNIVSLINIDCGRTFEYLENTWIEENHAKCHFNPLFMDYLNKFIKMPKFRIFTHQFLAAINLEVFSRELKIAFEDFEKFTLNTWVSKFVKQSEKAHYSSKEIGCIALITGDHSFGSKIESIDHLIALVDKKKSSLNQLFSLHDKVGFDYKDTKEEISKISSEQYGNIL